MYYIGLDVHKKTISYCIKDVSGQVQREATILATCPDFLFKLLDNYARARMPWSGKCLRLASRRLRIGVRALD